MPQSPKRPCAYHGCKELVTSGYCEKHKSAGYDSRRGSSTKRGYGYAWKKDRDAFLEAHPYCCDPYGIHKGELVKATVADHVIPRSQGGSEDWSNRQAFCATCHDMKTAREDGGFGNPIKGRGTKKVLTSQNVNRAGHLCEKNSQCEKSADIKNRRFSDASA